MADVPDSDTGVGRIQERDTQGNWSVRATVDPLYHVVGGKFEGRPAYLAADTTGNLYIAVYYGGIQKLDPQGHWAILGGDQFFSPTALAVDTPGNLYLADNYRDTITGDDLSRIRKRDAQGHWSVLATQEVNALAVDTTGNLYVASGTIQKRDAQGNWSVIATLGSDLGRVWYPTSLAVDAAGNLYVADTGNNRVLKYTPGP